MKFKRAILFMVITGFLFAVNGCIYIPPNEHVGKPAPHSYKDGYYDDYYYHSYHRY